MFDMSEIRMIRASGSVEVTWTPPLYRAVRVRPAGEELVRARMPVVPDRLRTCGSFVLEATLNAMKHRAERKPEGQKRNRKRVKRMNPHVSESHRLGRPDVPSSDVHLDNCVAISHNGLHRIIRLDSSFRHFLQSAA